MISRLDDHFTSPTGEFSGYLDGSGDPVATGKHYDLRSFHSDEITIANSMINFRNNNTYSFNGKTMGELNARTTFTGTGASALDMNQLDAFKMVGLDSNLIVDLEGVIVPGNENWTGSGLTLNRDSSYGYENVIEVTLTDGVTSTITSTYTDDIWTNFQDDISYVIELELLGFPAQSSSPHLDLDNSFIDFTSSPSYSAGQTDSIAFSQSTTDITGTGDLSWRIPRDILVKCTLSNITGIRFRLLSVGNMTFKAAAMRVYTIDENNYFDVNQDVRIDTKRSWVYKRFQHYTLSGGYGDGLYGSGDYSSGTPDAPGDTNPMILPGSSPKNVTVVSKFMPGTVLATSASNLTLYARFYNYPVSGTISYTSTATVLSISDASGEIYTSSTLDPLSVNTEYFLVFEVYENQLRLNLWDGTGTFLGANIFDSTWQTTSQPIGRGYIGFKFDPFNYDSYVKYFTVGDTEFARYESKTFERFTNSNGASIAAITSPPIDLVQGIFNDYGDGISSISTTKGFPLPPSVSAVRDGSQWSGGLITNPLFIGNPKYLEIEGSIFPVPTGGNINGEYKIVFMNGWGEIGYIATLRDILPNQWNTFRIPFNGDLAADEYRIIIEQTGYFNDTFYLSNFRLNYLTFAWEISPDSGSNFYSFLSSVGKEFTGVNFSQNPSSSLIIRGIALTGDSWIQNYELVPIKSSN